MDNFIAKIEAVFDRKFKDLEDKPLRTLLELTIAWYVIRKLINKENKV